MIVRLVFLLDDTKSEDVNPILQQEIKIASVILELELELEKMV